MVRRVTAVIAVVIMLAACDAYAGDKPGDKPSSLGPLSTSPCRSSGPVRPDAVMAMIVNPQGAVCWQAALPAKNISSQPRPVASDNLAYFAVGSQIKAVRLTDGRSMWTWSGHPVEGLPGVSPYAMGLDGMWLGAGVLVVSQAATLTGLNSLTGAVR